MKIVVNESLCEGYGKCERVAPDLFKPDENGLAVVLIEGPLGPEQLERAKAAVNLCPMNAISLSAISMDLEETTKVSEESQNGGAAAPQETASTSACSAPFERHVFVCTSGEYCPTVDGDSIEIHKAFKEQVAQAGLKGRIRVNKSGCLGQCGHGPNVVIYPEGVWYSHLTVEDVPHIISEHLIGGRPVERLRFHPPKTGANKLKRDAANRRIVGQVDGCRPDWPIIPEDNSSVGGPSEDE